MNSPIRELAASGLLSAVADPPPLPAPPWLLWGLLLVTFFLHVVAMNFVLGGSLIAALAHWRGNDEQKRLAQWIGKSMPTMLAAAITFGVAPLLFLQALYGRLFFTSSVLMAWPWWAVIPMLILAYYGAYAIAFRKDFLGHPDAIIASLVALLLLGVAFLYSNNMSLMLRPAQFSPMLLEDARGLHLNSSDPTLIPRFLHMVAGAGAVAGLIVALAGIDGWATRHGIRWFRDSTLVGMIAGIWWTMVIPSAVLKAIAASLTVGVFLSLAAVVLGDIALRARHPLRVLRAAAALTAATLMVMIVSRDQMRTALLEAAGSTQRTWIEPQWGPIAIFAVLLAGAVGTSIWMVRSAARAH